MIQNKIGTKEKGEKKEDRNSFHFKVKGKGMKRAESYQGTRAKERDEIVPKNQLA